MSTGMTAVFWRTVQDSNRAALRSRVSNQPSGLLLSPRFPTARNVYQERCRPTIRSGDFFRGGRYRTRTAAEATAACGGNREPRLGPRSDFSKPCQGAAEKSANATRCCCLARGSQRLGMSTGMTAVLWWAVQDSNRDKQRQDIPMRAVSCLLIF